MPVASEVPDSPSRIGGRVRIAFVVLAVAVPLMGAVSCGPANHGLDTSALPQPPDRPNKPGAPIGMQLERASGQGVLAIDVPTDRRAKYTAMSIDRSRHGMAVIVTRRDGTGGVSFVRRDCSCLVGRYRILGDGNSICDAMRDQFPGEDYSQLTDGSISTYVCTFACKQ